MDCTHYLSQVDHYVSQFFGSLSSHSSFTLVLTWRSSSDFHHPPLHNDPFPDFPLILHTGNGRLSTLHRSSLALPDLILVEQCRRNVTQSLNIRDRGMSESSHSYKGWGLCCLNIPRPYKNCHSTSLDLLPPTSTLESYLCSPTSRSFTLNPSL